MRSYDNIYNTVICKKNLHIAMLYILSYERIYIYTHTHTHIYIYIYIYIYICVCVCMYVWGGLSLNI